MQHKTFLLALSFLGAFPLLASAQNRVISTDNTNIAAAQNGGRVLSATSTFDDDPLYAGSNLIDGQVWSATRAGSSRGQGATSWLALLGDARGLHAQVVGGGGVGSQAATIGNGTPAGAARPPKAPPKWGPYDRSPSPVHGQLCGPVLVPPPGLSTDPLDGCTEAPDGASG